MFRKMQKEWMLKKAEDTLKWFKEAANYDSPTSIVGSISSMTIMGNVVDVNIQLTPALMKKILEYNSNRLIATINVLKEEPTDDEL